MDLALIYHSYNEIILGYSIGLDKERMPNLELKYMSTTSFTDQRVRIRVNVGHIFFIFLSSLIQTIQTTSVPR